MNIHHEKAYTSIMNLSHKITPLWQAVLTDIGVTPIQAEVMLSLTQDGINIRRISELLGVTSSAATQLVEILKKRGMVDRINSTEDRRIVNVNLTEKGKHLQERLLTAQKVMIETIVGALSESDVDELQKIHAKMLSSIEQHNG